MKKLISILMTLVLCASAVVAYADVDKESAEKTTEDITVVTDGKTLENGIDYILTYKDNINAGTATIVIDFIGNYAGTMEKTFKIVSKNHTSYGGGSGGSRGGHVIKSDDDKVTIVEVTPEPKKEYDLPYLTGYADNTFRPDAKITRAEATTAVVRALRLNVNKESKIKFDDVSNHWAKDYINAATLKGIIDGYNDNSFLPDCYITRAEFAKIIAKTYGATSQDGKIKFTDISNHWAKPYITYLTENNIINGYQDGTFQPDAQITRAEAVAIINRAITRNCAPDIKIDFKDVTKNHWAYSDIVQAAGIENKDK